MLKIANLIRIGFLSCMVVGAVGITTQFTESNDKVPQFEELNTGGLQTSYGYYLGQDVLTTPDLSHLVVIYSSGTKIKPNQEFDDKIFCNYESKKCDFAVPKPGFYDVYVTRDWANKPKLSDITPDKVQASTSIHLETKAEPTTLTKGYRKYYIIKVKVTGD